MICPRCKRNEITEGRVSSEQAYYNCLSCYGFIFSYANNELAHFSFYLNKNLQIHCNVFFNETSIWVAKGRIKLSEVKTHLLSKTDAEILEWIKPFIIFQ